MTNRLTAQNVLVAILLTAGIYAGYTLRGWTSEPEVVTKTKTDTTVVERTITKTDTITKTRPVEVIRYDTVAYHEIDTITVEVPTRDSAGVDVPWHPFGLIDRQPLDIDGRTATLSYWKLSERRWEQRRYRFKPKPRPVNRLSPYAAAQLLPSAAAVHTGLEYARTFRDAWLFSSVTTEWHGGYGLTEGGRGPVAGVTVTADVRW